MNKLVVLAILVCITATTASCSPREIPVRNMCLTMQVIRFGNQATIDFLSQNNRPLLESIVTHNEKLDRICNNEQNS